MTPECYLCLKVTLLVQLLQAVGALFVCYVPPRTTRWQNWYWWKFGHYVSWLNMKILFIVLPLVYIGLFTWKTVDGTIFSDKNKIFASWFGAYAILSLFTIIAYFFIIKDLEATIGESLGEMDEQKAKEEEDKEEIEQKLKRQNTYGYRGQSGSEYFREPGAGPLRISSHKTERNKAIKIRNDLYSMLFVTSMRPEYIWHWKHRSDVL